MSRSTSMSPSVSVSGRGALNRGARRSGGRGFGGGGSGGTFGSPGPNGSTIGKTLNSQVEAGSESPTDSLQAPESSDQLAVADLSIPEEIDLDRIWRTLARSLLMLALGADAKDIGELPKKGIDGKPLVFEGTVEVTVLWDPSCDQTEARQSMSTAGLSIQSSAANGSIVVGRIDITRLLQLSQTACVRRIVPTSVR